RPSGDPGLASIERPPTGSDGGIPSERLPGAYHQGTCRKEVGRRDSLRLSSIQLLHPDVANVDLGGGLYLDAEQSRLIVRGSRIIVDHDGHQLSVQDMHARAAARDYSVLVPVVHLGERAQGRAISDIAHELFAGKTRSFDHL